MLRQIFKFVIMKSLWKPFFQILFLVSFQTAWINFIKQKKFMKNKYVFEQVFGMLGFNGVFAVNIKFYEKQILVNWNFFSFNLWHEPIQIMFKLVKNFQVPGASTRKNKEIPDWLLQSNGGVWYHKALNLF